MEDNLRYYKKGDVIFREGSFEMWMYVLKQGTVGIFANYGQPGEKLLTEVKGEGATFGEMGLIDSMRRSATAAALEDVEVCVISGENFGSYFGDDPEVPLGMMRYMSSRIRELTDDYMEACRAVTEAMEGEAEGKTKSGWFREKVSKFISDYADAIASTSETGNIYYPFGKNR